MIGWSGVPERVIRTDSGYALPGQTRTVCPGSTTAAAAEIVQYGWAKVPGPRSEQARSPELLTWMVVPASAVGPAEAGPGRPSTAVAAARVSPKA